MKIFKSIIAAVVLFPTAAFSGIDCGLDGGFIAHAKGYDSWHEKNQDKFEIISGPIGFLEINCKSEKAEIFIVHMSDVQAKDTGMNGIGVRFRLID